MTFSDEDLNRWKSVIATCINIGSEVCDDHSRINHRTLIGLLARLEAAEELTEIALRELEGSVFFKDQPKLDKAIRKWRKACGK